MFHASKFRYLASRQINAQRHLSATLNGYGVNCFKGAVAAPYLVKHGLAANVLDDPKWPTEENADKVARSHEHQLLSNNGLRL